MKAAEDRKTGRIEILSPDATIQNIRLNPNETFAVNVEFALAKDYTPRQGAAAQFDLIQVGAPGEPDKIVGGQRFTVDLSKLVLVKSDDQWRYWDQGTSPGAAWTSLDYDDSKWKLGEAPLGSGGRSATRVDVGPSDRRNIATYFRHAFDVADPGFYKNALLRLMRADGAVVYLNGKEVYRVNLTARAVSTSTTATRQVTGLERDVFFPVKIDPAMLRQGKNIIAVEIHANSPQRDDIKFALELFANVAAAGFPPDVAFAAPADAAVFQSGEIVPVRLEALSGDAKIASVSLYADGRLVGTAERAPYTFNWPVGSNGPHRLRAVAVDNLKKQSESFHTITVVEKVLPQVQLVAPKAMTEATEGEELSVSAEASDRTGKIARVEFWAKDMATWVSPSTLVATVTSPPYTASIKDLKPGEYMVWAIAVNDRGGTTQSVPTHVMINARK
jgi:hypothetical protein